MAGRGGGGWFGAPIASVGRRKKKNQCRGYSCDASLFTSRRRGASAEREGLIGEGFWELRAGQLGVVGWEEEGLDGLRRAGRETLPPPTPPFSTPLTPLPSYLLRWIIKHDGIKQNKLTGNVQRQHERRQRTSLPPLPPPRFISYFFYSLHKSMTAGTSK